MSNRIIINTLVIASPLLSLARQFIRALECICRRFQKRLKHNSNGNKCGTRFLSPKTKLRFDKCRCHFDMELIHSEIAGIAKCDIAAGTKWRSSKKRNVKLILTVVIVALLLSGYVPHGKKPTMIDRCSKIGANIEFFVLRCAVMPSLATIKMSAAHKSN